MLKVILIIIVFGFLQTGQAHVHPEIEWNRLQSEHFELIFNAKQRELAEAYLLHAERAHALLIPIFKEAPAQKTVVILRDDTDLANGMAMGIPQPTITAYPVLPGIQDSIADYTIWSRDLLLHEYTHILNFEPANGVMTPLRWIFGSIVRPNGLLPRWYLEGLAVYLETAFSQHGRLRSSQYRGMVRAMVAENILEKEPFERINESSIPEWPLGSRPYFFGAWLWQKMGLLGGHETIGLLNESYSQRLPFLLNGPAESRFGQDYSGLLAQVYSEMKSVTQEELLQIARQEVTPKGTPVPAAKSSYFQTSPTLSADGRHLAYVDRTMEEEDLITIQNLSDGAIRKFAYRGVQRVSWRPDSQGIIFDHLSIHDQFYTFYDLSWIDLKSGQATRLTRGRRASEPSASPDGKSVVFVSRGDGETALWKLHLESKQEELLYRPMPGNRLSRPLFFSDEEILFSERDSGGLERLKSLSMKVGKVTEIFPTLSPAHSPEFAQGGRGLTFVSEKSGVSNLYFAPSLKSAPLPLTNVETSIQNGAYSVQRQETYLARMSGRGMLIEKVKTPVQSKLLPAIQSKWDDPSRWPEFVEPEVKLADGISAEPYAPSRYLWPQYWMPFFSLIPQGVFVQGSLASADPLRKHVLGLDLSYDNLSNRPSLAARYTNQTTRYPMGLAFANVSSYLYGAEQVIQNSSAVASMSFNLPGLFDSLSFVGAYSYLSSQFPVRDSSGSIVTETATRSGPILGATYSNLMQRGNQISPNQGYRLAGQLTYYLPQVGTVSYPQLSLDGLYFFSKWLPDRHALMARMNAVFSPNDRNFLLGTVSAGGEFFGSFIGVKYAVRGYPPGNFIGWSLVNTTLEYRLPFSDPMRGYLNGLFFLRNWHAAVLLDAAVLDGAFVSRSRERFIRDRWQRVFMGTGVEVRAESTALFHVPVQWRFGLFQGLDSEAFGGLTPFFGMVVEGLPI